MTKEWKAEIKQAIHKAEARGYYTGLERVYNALLTEIGSEAAMETVGLGWLVTELSEKDNHD